MAEPAPIDLDMGRIRLLNTSQVAKALGISQWTLSRWLREGTFPRPLMIKASNAYKWRLRDIEGFLERQARTPWQKAALRGIAKRYAERHQQERHQPQKHEPQKRVRLIRWNDQDRQ